MDGGLGVALSSTHLALNSNHSFQANNPVPLPSDPAAPLSGPSGATAQTGGFVGTGPTSNTSSADFLRGGLASSPNVPRPGTSIDPATGKPHVAGLTRAELEAKRALEASSSAASTSASADSGAGTIDGKPLGDLPGREQAARQLTGTVDGASAAGTPIRELPGGWGPAKQVPVPGSAPNAPTSVYEDIAEGLEKVGTAAFNLIPQGLKDALNPDHPVDKGKQPMGSPPKPRRSSVGVFFDNVKQGTGQLIHEVQDTFQADRRASVGSNRSNRSAGSGGVTGSEPSVLAQVKTFFAESVNTVETQVQSQVYGTPIYRPPQSKASLPTSEKAGALPGEQSAGVGALPGKSSEAGVAVLPEEKKPDHTAATGNQPLLPGETTGGTPAGGVGDLPGKPTEAGVAVLPEEKKLDKDHALADGVAITAPLAAAAVGAGLVVSNNIATGTASHKEIGLAPPLPATHLGEGAANGATDLERAGLSSSTPSTAPASIASANAPSVADSTTAVDSRQANDRTTSTASITAIRHGHEGQRPSPLSESTVKEDIATSDDKIDGQKSTTRGTGPAHTASLTPGSEAEGVGHPSTRAEGTTRSPGSYPAADRGAKGASGEDASPKPVTATTGPAASQLSNGTTASPNHTATTPVASSPKTAVVSDSDKGHRRTGSNVSTGSNGKKKVGFMNKLKGEIKVIGGKLSHDEKKVEEGQKLKHGEL